MRSQSSKRKRPTNSAQLEVALNRRARKETKESNRKSNNINISQDRNALTKAVEEGCSEKSFTQLLTNTNDSNSVNDALSKACEIGAKVFFIIKLLNHSAVAVKLKGKRYDNRTPIHLCCTRDAGSNGVVNLRLLLNKGYSVDIKTNKGATPLHLASRKGLTDHVNVLLKHNADVNVTDDLGNTPLHCASGVEGGDGNPDVVQVLIDNGADIDVENNRGDTAMSAASKNGQSKIVEMLSKGNKSSSCKNLHSSSFTQDVHTPTIVNRLEALEAEVELSPDQSRGILERLEDIEKKVYKNTENGRIIERIRKIEYDLI